jgi:protein-L-isoaspartate(D-aspartate) O-methyltransferase
LHCFKQALLNFDINFLRTLIAIRGSSQRKKRLFGMTDNYRHKGLRKQLVEELKKKGISDMRVLGAIDKVPRHLFMDDAFIAFAYKDAAFQIGAGQTISQPYTVAFQSQLLEVKAGEKVLEIGTGSGYQTCVLLELGAKVYTIERQKVLYDKAKALLPQLKYNPRVFYGDGYKGLPVDAPFDKILVTCGAPFVPDALLKQLKTGGILVIPVGEGDIQVMTAVVKTGEDQYDRAEFGKFSFVPMLEKKARDA